MLGRIYIAFIERFVFDVGKMMTAASTMKWNLTTPELGRRPARRSALRMRKKRRFQSASRRKQVSSVKEASSIPNT